MGFPDALRMVFSGYRLARAAGPSSARYIFLETREILSPDDNSQRFECQVFGGDDNETPAPFVPSQEDMFATDWELQRR